MKRIIFIIGALLVLSACSRNVDGTYIAQERVGLLGMLQTNIIVIIGEEGAIEIPGRKRLYLNVVVEGERVVMFSNKPSDGIIFNIRDDGNTLDCSQCEQLGMPRSWEKKIK